MCKQIVLKIFGCFERLSEIWLFPNLNVPKMCKGGGLDPGKLGSGLPI